MSVPFSNTNLRIPRGFGNLLEGLAKEVLRDQPEDIPTFAARYFTELLKAREESSRDPAEWGARLEDRFYNNHAFKERAPLGSSSSPKANIRSKTNDSETFGNNGTQHSTSKELSAKISPDNSEDTEVKKKYELDKKLDEESGEAKHGPTAEISSVETADVDICAQEVTENTDVLRDHKAENEDVDICKSEFEPTPLPSFGGLANVNVCAEEINPSSTAYESTEDDRDLESPKPLLLDGQPSESLDVQNSQDNQITESFAEIPSHIEQDIGKQADEMSDDENTEEPEFCGHIEESEQGVSEITDALLKDTGPKEKSIEKVSLEESAKNGMTENSTTEQETEDHLEEKDELKDNEDQETSYEYSSTPDFEPTAETIGIKETYIDYTDETHDSRSEVIDVLDEVVMYTGEHETENSNGEKSTSKIIGAMMEEDILESQTDSAVPDFQLNDYEVTEDVTGNEILNTDVMDTSERDPITETVNEASDLESDSCDAEEMNQDDMDKEENEQTESMISDDLSNMHNKDIMKTDDGNNDFELKEDVLASEMEEAHHETREEEVITDEHPTENREQCEQTGEDQEDQFEDQEDKNQESSLYMENQENPESSELKEECNQPHEEEDIMDIPLDDPEANKAAAKIQAGFRGHMTRKKMKPDEKTGEEVSSTGEALNGSEGNTEAGGTDGVETDATSGPEQ